MYITDFLRLVAVEYPGFHAIYSSYQVSLDASTLFAVKSLVAVITGGGNGIGLMMAKALAMKGRTKSTKSVAAKESPRGNIIAVAWNVTSKDALKSIAHQTEQDVGYLNVLIANSVVAGP